MQSSTSRRPGRGRGRGQPIVESAAVDIGSRWTHSIRSETLDGGDKHGFALGVNDLSIDHDLSRRLDVRVESATTQTTHQRLRSHNTAGRGRAGRFGDSLDDESVVPHVLAKPRVTTFFPLSELEPGCAFGPDEVQAQRGRLVQLSVDGIGLASRGRTGMFDLLSSVDRSDPSASTRPPTALSTRMYVRIRWSCNSYHPWDRR